MINLKAKLSIMSVALVSTTGIYAASDEDHGITLAIDTGRAEAHQYCQDLVDCEDSDTSVRIALGYQFDKNWSSEFGYTSFGTLLDSNDNNFNASQKSNAFTLSGIAALPITENLSLFGRAGIARYQTNGSGTIQGVPVKDKNGFNPYFGAGVEYDFTSSFSLRAEFQYYADISRVDGSEDDVQGLFAGAVFHF